MRRSSLSIIVAIAVLIGFPVGLFVAAAHQAISPRELGIGMVSWFAALLVFAAFRKRAADKGTVVPRPDTPTLLDRDARRRVQRQILVRKIWIGVLVVLLPIGIANGIAHRAWLPMLGGVGISLLWIYVTIGEIRRRRKRLGDSLGGA